MTKRSATRWRRLARELPTTVAAGLATAMVEIGLRVTTLPKLTRLLGVPLDPAMTGHDDTMRSSATTLTESDLRRVRSTQRVLRRWPFGDTCLRQALVSGVLLRHHKPVLHVGVARIDGEIKAHAWLAIGSGILDPLTAAGSYRGLTAPGKEPAP